MNSADFKQDCIRSSQNYLSFKEILQFSVTEVRDEEELAHISALLLPCPKKNHIRIGGGTLCFPLLCFEKATKDEKPKSQADLGTSLSVPLL